jgi:hypothetical protein
MWKGVALVVSYRYTLDTRAESTGDPSRRSFPLSWTLSPVCGRRLEMQANQQSCRVDRLILKPPDSVWRAC